MTTDDLTLEEKATNNDTWRHIWTVQKYLLGMTKKLIDRAHAHDQTKLAAPEVALFTEFTPKLASTTYGSEEYEGYRKALGPALDHHYGHNDHHPEHFKSGLEDMNLLQLLEMFCDWKAASERHSDGNIRKSIEINAERFGMTPQLRRIFENTVNTL